MKRNVTIQVNINRVNEPDVVVVDGSAFKTIIVYSETARDAWAIAMASVVGVVVSIVEVVE